MTTTPRTKLVRPIRGGQMTIPADFRHSLGATDDAMLRVTRDESELRMTQAQADAPSKGSPGLRALYEYFAPVREEILARGISQEELFADIDAAITEVRAEQRAKRG